MSALNQLLTIKEWRQQQAEIALVRQRQTVESAQSAVNLADEALEDYRVWATRREAAVYQELCSKVVRLREIEEARETVAELRQQELQHIATLDKARECERSESEHLTAVHREYQGAARMTQKFSELVRLQDAEALSEDERLADLEMEEVGHMSLLAFESTNGPLS